MLDNFREWLSDNLRYIGLIFGILVILVGLFFGVRAVTNRVNRGEENPPAPDSVISESVPAAESEAAPATATPTPEPTPVGGELKMNEVTAVSELVRTYYQALTNKDLETVRECADELPEEEEDAILASSTVYKAVDVYTKNGLTLDSYVVYAAYRYRNDDQLVDFPGLSQMLVRKDTEDGQFKIIFTGYDQETSDYIDSLAETEDVKALVAKLTEEYELAERAEEKAREEGEAAEEEEAESEAEEAESEEEEPEEEPEEEEKEPDYRSASIKRACFLRSQPVQKESTKIRTLKKDEHVLVLEEASKGWTKVRTDDGTDGYVGAQFVS